MEDFFIINVGNKYNLLKGENLLLSKNYDIIKLAINNLTKLPFAIIGFDFTKKTYSVYNAQGVFCFIANNEKNNTLISTKSLCQVNQLCINGNTYQMCANKFMPKLNNTYLAGVTNDNIYVFASKLNVTNSTNLYLRICGNVKKITNFFAVEISQTPKLVLSYDCFKHKKSINACVLWMEDDLAVGIVCYNYNKTENYNFLGQRTTNNFITEKRPNYELTNSQLSALMES